MSSRPKLKLPPHMTLGSPALMIPSSYICNIRGMGYDSITQWSFSTVHTVIFEESIPSDAPNKAGKS